MSLRSLPFSAEDMMVRVICGHFLHRSRGANRVTLLTPWPLGSSRSMVSCRCSDLNGVTHRFT
jgi:hypothetical protein